MQILAWTLMKLLKVCRTRPSTLIWPPGPACRTISRWVLKIQVCQQCACITSILSLDLPSIMSTPEIPVELWSEIFTFSRAYNARSVQTLVRVSRSFRDIVNATPQLWETGFTITERELADMQRILFLMRKSGGLPLQIRIDLPQSLVLR